VVKGKTAFGKPSTVWSLTIGTRSTSSSSTTGSSSRATAMTSSADPTIRNITSADADGEITFGAMPPSMSPML